MTSIRRAALSAVAVVASSIPTLLVAQTADTKTTKSTARPSIATPIPDSLEPTAEVKNVGKVQVKGSQSSAPKAPIDKEELKRQLMRQLGIPPGANVTIEIEDDGPQLEGEAEAATSPSPKEGGNDESKSQPSATKVGEVVVKGNADKFGDPTKTVIGIDQLSDPSDRNLLDVLEKQSGIIVRDDGVSINGLPPSYTQILYDGRKFPAGMSLSTLRPEQVDRIEISFGADAAQSAGGMAGTINVIPKKRISKRSGNLGVSESTGARTSHGVFASFNDRFDSGSNYSLFGNISRSDSANGSISKKEWRNLAIPNGFEEYRSSGRYKGNYRSMNARSNWILPDGSWLGGSIALTRLDNSGFGEDHFAVDGTPTVRRGGRTSDYSNRSVSPELSWDKSLGSKLSLKTSARYTDYSADTHSTYAFEQRPGSSLSRITSDSKTTFADLVLIYQPSKGTEIQFGGSTEQSDEVSSTRVDTTVSGISNYFMYRDRSRDENAVFMRLAQRLTPRLGLNTGLRWTQLRMKPNSLHGSSQSYLFDSSFLSPSLNLAFRQNERNTWLFNYSRTFKAPQQSSLDTSEDAPSLADQNMPLNAIYRGNASLQAEVTDSIVFTFSRRWTPTIDSNINASYRRLDNPLTFVIYNDGGTWYRQPTNINSTHYWSISMSGKYWRTFGSERRVTVLVTPSFTRSWNRIDQVPSDAGGFGEFTPISAFLGVQLKSGAVVGKARINYVSSATTFGGLQIKEYQSSQLHGSVGVTWAASPKLIVGAQVEGIGANKSPLSRTIYSDGLRFMSTEYESDPDPMGPTLSLTLNYRF